MPSGFSASAAMAMNALSITVCLLLASHFVCRRLRTGARVGQLTFRHREWIGVAFASLLISSSSMVLKRTDTIMVGAILGATQAGVYSAVVRTSMFMLFGLQAINAALAPMISTYHVLKKHDELRKLLRVAAWGTLLITVLISTLILYSGSWILSLFGNEFARGYNALVVLALSQIVNALAGPVGYVMMMTGHHRQAAIFMLGGLGLNLALNAIAIPMMGLDGAAFATAFSTVAWNFGMLTFVIVRLKLNPTVFGRT